MLVTLREILADAEQKQYGVGLFNILNLEMARGIIAAAEQERSPLILGVAEVHLPYIPFDYASMVMHKILAEATVPVCLHFDHGTDLGKIKEALSAGFSSVMYDGSALPYDENIANTAATVTMAQHTGSSVEAELGHVGGAEDGSDDGCEQQYTQVEQVCNFIDRTGIDALAIAIGTVHGQYRAKPKLDIARLAAIHAVSSKPLVLHGGSGLSDDDFCNTIQNGIRKVNICTEMCLATHQAYREASSLETGIVQAVDSVKQVVAQKMRLFGSAGKA